MTYVLKQEGKSKGSNPDYVTVITFENEENQKKFDRLVKYGEEYNKRDD